MAGLVGDLRRRPGDVLASGAPGEPLLVWVGAVVSACPACSGRSRDGMLCHGCMRTTRKALEHIAEWWPTLEETITRQARLRTPAASGAVFRPVPFEPAASALADEIHSDLVGWVRILAEEMAGPWPERDSTPALARHLEHHLTTLRRHEAADSLPALDCWPGKIRRAVDYPDERGKIKVGPCPERVGADETSPGEACSGIVWARFFEGSEQRPTMTCEPPPTPGAVVCGREWPAGQWREPATRILRRMDEQRVSRERAAHYAPKVDMTEPPAPLPRASIIPLVTIADAAIIYGIPEGTIRRWLTEGKLWPFGSRSARFVSAWQVADVGGKHRRFPSLSGPAGPPDPIAERTLRGVS